VKTPSVAAVVVTRNRLALLQVAMTALREQSRELDAIIVVDNASTDGTPAWLSQQPDLIVIRQENLGSGGGQHTGMKAAYERGYDWIWGIDDDGRPDVRCLERLLERNESPLPVRAPLVLNKEDSSQLAFPLFSDAGSQPTFVRAEAEAKAQNGLLWDFACPFNGVLIHRQVVETIGLPISDLFLYGDEVDYVSRIRAADFPIATIIAAEFHHPQDRMRTTQFSFLGRSLGVMQGSDALRSFLIVRNYGYITRKYMGWIKAFKHTARYAVFYGQTEGVRGACWAVSAALAGAMGRLKGHRRYLR